MMAICSDKENVKFPTQPAITEMSEEDGSNLEELLDVLTVEEADITGPIMAVVDEPLMMLGSDPNIIKEDFSNELDGKHSEDKSRGQERRTWNPGITYRQSGRNILSGLIYNVSQHFELLAYRLAKRIFQRRLWDPEITHGDILKQHLEDNVFLKAGLYVPVASKDMFFQETSEDVQVRL
ncbi:hypothetical protein Tco_0511193 [Tanacetum coccineum]